MILFTLLFVLGACNASEGKEAVDQGEKKETLIMATSPDYPPFEFYNLVDGEQEIVGFDIDIAKYIAEKLGYELEIRDMEFDGLIGSLQSERVDFVMAGMQATEERKKSVDFSNVYYGGAQSMVFRKDSGFSGPEDLAGLTIGAQLGTTSEQMAQEIMEQVDGIELKPLGKLNTIIMEVKNNRLDAAILSESVAKAYLSVHEDLDYLPLEGEQAGNAIAFPKNSDLVDKFNEVLAEMEESGKLDELIKKWFEEAQEEAE